MTLQKWHDTKDTLKNNKLVNLIKRGLRWLRDGTNDMSEDEIKIEKPNKI